MLTSPSSFLLPLLVGLVVGALAGWSWATARSAAAGASGRDEVSRLRASEAAWRARAEELGERAQLAEERRDHDGSVLRALAPVRGQLEQMAGRVAQMEQERSEQHALLAERLRAAARTEHELLVSTTALEGALRSRSARGVWGEVELARVLEASGMMPHIDFSEQRSAGTGRPDVTVHLPGDAHLALDAKTPMDSYLSACAVEPAPGEERAATERRRRDLLAAHARALRAHVDELAGRCYDRSLPSSPELVVLFVPAEPVLAAALEADPTLLEHALGRGVALASPPSLLALLRTCAMAWTRTAVNQDAAELLDLGRTLYERLGTVARHLDQLGSTLQRSVVAYNRVVGSVESRLLVTARAFESLAGNLPEVPPISPDSAQIKTFSAPGLGRTSDDVRAATP